MNGHNHSRPGKQLFLPLFKGEIKEKKNRFVPHPAKYSDELLPLFRKLLIGHPRVLDPFAGTGKLRQLEINSCIYLNELEQEWAVQGPADSIADALHLPYPPGVFDAICTSPTYGNRMADHHNARDKSKRNTYKHCIGRPLHQANSGQLQWGLEYQVFHVNAWKECRRVLRTGGRFIIVIKDHIREGRLMEVSKWHIETLRELGFVVEEKFVVQNPCLRYGANSDRRVCHENVIALRG